MPEAVSAPEPARTAGKGVAGAEQRLVGYAKDDRLDNTIRYSSAEVRDLQHAAAILFTDPILYEAQYYKSTTRARCTTPSAT